MQKHVAGIRITRVIFLLIFLCLFINTFRAAAETVKATKQELFNEASVLKYIHEKNPQISDYLKDLKQNKPQEYFKTILLYENMRESENNADQGNSLACPECAAFAQRLKKEKPVIGKEDEKKILDYIKQGYPEAYQQVAVLKDYSPKEYKKLLEIYSRDMDAKGWLKINRPQELEQMIQRQAEAQAMAKQTQKIITSYAAGSISRQKASVELSEIFLPDLRQAYHPAYINLQISHNEGKIKWMEGNKRAKTLPKETCDQEINSLQTENKALQQALKGDFSGLALLQAERILLASDVYLASKK